jgi:hypothetical protein
MWLAHIPPIGVSRTVKRPSLGFLKAFQLYLQKCMDVPGCFRSRPGEDFIPYENPMSILGLSELLIDGDSEIYG